MEANAAEDMERLIAAREKVRAEDPQFFAAVEKAMFEHDPIRINYEINNDEYEDEAGTVIPRLVMCSSSGDVLTVLLEEFGKSFGGSLGDRDRYVALANDIWGLWQHRGPDPPFRGTLRDKAEPRS
jgi:hypothetical protein